MPRWEWRDEAREWSWETRSGYESDDEGEVGEETVWEEGYSVSSDGKGLGNRWEGDGGALAVKRFGRRRIAGMGIDCHEDVDAFFF
ncbi:hypothetical protein DsansV1_C03g0024141 [Dioscorea sansibarensis]